MSKEIQFNKWENAQTICEKIYVWVSAQFRAGFSIRLNGGNYSDLTEHIDWRDGKNEGFHEAEKLIDAGLIFFVYPFECEREKCPRRFQYGGYWACNSCNTHIDTPEWWKIKVMKDGDAYCCIGTGFVNLQESNNYAFGNSFQDAINQYWHKHYETTQTITP